MSTDEQLQKVIMFLLIHSMLQGLTLSVLTARQTKGFEWTVEHRSVSRCSSDSMAFSLGKRSKANADQIIPVPPLASLQGFNPRSRLYTLVYSHYRTHPANIIERNWQPEPIQHNHHSLPT